MEHPIVGERAPSRCVCMCVCVARFLIFDLTSAILLPPGGQDTVELCTEDRYGDGVDKTPVRVICQVDGMGARGTTIPHW